MLVRLRSAPVKASGASGQSPSDHVEQENLIPASKVAQKALKLTQHHSCKHLGKGAGSYGVGSGKG